MISPVDWGTLRIAVCMSGIARGNVSKHISLLKKAFPSADFYFATWNEHDNKISQKYNSKTYPEPILHYNPWMECITDCQHIKYKEYKKQFIHGQQLSKRTKLLHMCLGSQSLVRGFHQNCIREKACDSPLGSYVKQPD